MQENQYKIYIVEDDTMLAEEIGLLLGRWGYAVTCVAEFDDILGEVVALQTHVILMDVNIPRFDGFYWCRRIRETSAVLNALRLKSDTDTLTPDTIVSETFDDYRRGGDPILAGMASLAE